MQVAVVSSARWSAFSLSKHYVARALAAAGHHVLYVDPPISPLSLVRHPQRWRDFAPPATRRAGDGLDVWTPRVLPGQNSRFGQAANGAILRRGLRNRQGAPDLVVAFSLESRGWVGRLPGRRVYYCTDSIEDQPGFDRPRVEMWERQLASAVHTVVACSRPLVDQLGERGIESVYIPHGCDPVPQPSDPGVPAELRERRRPLLGYVGSLNFRINPDLLEGALEATNGTLVLVGAGFGPAADPRMARLVRRPDVVATGHREGQELGRILRELDAALVPYGDGPFNRKSFPLKIPQYLAAGLPVVSTPNGATDEMGDLVEVASSPAEFAAAVRRALDADTAELRAERARRARARTWDVVAAELLTAAGLAGPAS